MKNIQGWLGGGLAKKGFRNSKSLAGSKYFFGFFRGGGGSVKKFIPPPTPKSLCKSFQRRKVLAKNSDFFLAEPSNHSCKVIPILHTKL